MDDPTRRALVRQAQQLVSAGDTGAACRLVESHSRRDDDEALRGWLGVFLVEHGEHARARALLQESLQRRPDFVPAALSLIQIPIRERRFDDAVDVYDDVAATIPQVRKRVRTTSQRSEVGRAFAEALRNSGAPARDCVVFYHLPFTGGTSAGRMLRYVFASGERYNIRRGGGLRHLARYTRLPDDRLQDLRYVHQHHPYPLDPRGRRLTYFTMLREPVARFLSGYFKRHDNPRIVGGGEWREHTGPSVLDAVEHLAEFGPTDAQARQLAILHPTLRDAYRHEYRPSRPAAESPSRTISTTAPPPRTCRRTHSSTWPPTCSRRCSSRRSCWSTWKRAICRCSPSSTSRSCCDRHISAPHARSRITSTT